MDALSIPGRWRHGCPDLPSAVNSLRPHHLLTHQTAMERFSAPAEVEGYNTIVGILVFRERKADPGQLTSDRNGDR
jgi:hypothetical protein